MVKSFEREKKLVERFTFSSVLHVNIGEAVLAHPEYLMELTTTDEHARYAAITPDSPYFTEMNTLYREISASKYLFDHEIIKHLDNNADLIRHCLGGFQRAGLLRCWMPEYSCVFEKAHIDGLYVLYIDGRYLYYHKTNPQNPRTLSPIPHFHGTS